MNKYVQSISLAIVILIGSLFFASPILTLYNFTHIERGEVEEDTLQVRNIIGNEAEQLYITAGDYAGWDEAYAFMRDGNRKFITSSLGEAFYSKLRLNLFCMITNDGRILYGRAHDIHNNVRRAIPPSLLQQLAPGSLLVKHDSPESSVRGFISLPEGLMLIVSRPILTSEYKGPIRGTLIIGRYFDQAESARISKLLHYEIEVLNSVSNSKDPAFRLLLSDLEKHDDVFVRVSQQRVTGHVQLTDIYGKTAGIVRLEKPRTIYHQVRLTTWRMILLYISMWLFIAFIFMLLRKKLTIVYRKKREVKVQLDSFFELAVDGIFSISSSGNILMVNSRVSEMTGYSSMELLEMRFGQLFGAGAAKDLQLDELLRGYGSNGVEHILVRKDGRHLFVELTSKKMPDDTFQCIIHDVSDYKSMEQQLIEHHDRISSMTIQVSVAEERERNRIAAELHDQVGPNLLLAMLKLDQLQSHLPNGRYENEFEAIKEFISKSIHDIRTLTLQLRPPILANAGLEAAVRWLAQDFEQNYGIQVSVQHGNIPIQLEYSIRLTLFQAVRELLLNAAKHSGAHHINIAINKDQDTLVLSVIDDGTGFSVPRDYAYSNSFGLFNTQQRIKYHGGNMHIESSPSQGTKVVMMIPLGRNATT